jgi:Tol biopolymer transport system component
VRAPHTRTRSLALVLALAAAGSAALVVPAMAATDDLELVSRATGPAGAPAADASNTASISADGQRVAFASEADNLSAEDVDSVRNVFVRDLAAGTTVLASRATGPSGAGGDDDSNIPAISSDGRYVVFYSDADNLAPGANPAATNIFVRDLVADTTTLVSRASGAGGAAADDDSGDPDISADGRYVVFESDADNLAPAANPAFSNIFVRDLVANTTRLVSRTPGAGGPGGDGNSFRPTISDDGSRIAFQSVASNLSTEDDDAVQDVFVRERATGTNTLVSRATGAGGAPGNASSDVAEISHSGRYVAFQSDDDDLAPGTDPAFANHIYLRDLDASTTTLASRADGPSGAGANDNSNDAAVSDNAQVAFSSGATNLSAEDNDAVNDIYVRDTLAGTTTLVSRGPGPGGAAGDAGSAHPTTSRDGRYVAFQSQAGNLVTGTIPGVGNIYRRDVLGDAPVATPACKTLPLPPSPPDKGEVTFTLTAQQLLINQRIGQAAIRRLNAVEARLDGGLAARDLCGYSVGPGQLGTGIVSAPAAASLAPVAPADPAPIEDPGRRGQGDPVTLTAQQLLINQRVYQAAIRRADGIEARLNTGLTGGDVTNGQVTQGKLYDRLQITARVPVAEPAPSDTVIPGRRGPGSPEDVTLSITQLKINQRIAQAGVRDSNALIRRLETGLSGADLRPGTLTAADLG